MHLKIFFLAFQSPFLTFSNAKLSRQPKRFHGMVGQWLLHEGKDGPGISGQRGMIKGGVAKGWRTDNKGKQTLLKFKSGYMEGIKSAKSLMGHWLDDASCREIEMPTC